MSEFRIILKTLRKSQGLLQKDIAEKLGISVATYSSYESGSREPSIDRLLEIADFFNVSVSELTGGKILPTGYNKDGSLDYTNSSYSAPKIIQFLAGEISAEDSGYTEEELESILQYAKFVKSQRKDEK